MRNTPPKSRRKRSCKMSLSNVRTLKSFDQKEFGKCQRKILRAIFRRGKSHRTTHLIDRCRQSRPVGPEQGGSRKHAIELIHSWVLMAVTPVESRVITSFYICFRYA